MKRIMTVAVLGILLAAMQSCGSSGGEEGNIPNPGGTGGNETSGPPTIVTINGTGIDGEVLDTVEVTGSNFSAPPEMEVYLVGDAETVALDFAVESDVKFSASLPLDIEPGDYALEVSNAFGKADAPLSLLQGEPGEPGISIEHKWLCLNSGDLEPDPNTVIKALGAEVWEFSDGSFFITCMTSMQYLPLGDYDTAYAVAFVPANIASADPTLIAAVAMYLHCQFTPSSAMVRYEDNGDPSNYQNVACSKTY